MGINSCNSTLTALFDAFWFIIVLDSKTVTSFIKKERKKIIRKVFGAMVANKNSVPIIGMEEGFVRIRKGNEKKE